MRIVGRTTERVRDGAVAAGAGGDGGASTDAAVGATVSVDAVEAVAGTSSVGLSVAGDAAAGA